MLREELHSLGPQRLDLTRISLCDSWFFEQVWSDLKSELKSQSNSYFVKPEKPWRTTQSPKAHYGFLMVWFGQLGLEKSCDFLNFSPFTPMGKTIKATLLPCGSLWFSYGSLHCWKINWISRNATFSKTLQHVNILDFLFEIYFATSQINALFMRVFPVFCIVFGNVVSPSICAPLPFLPRTLGRG
jgi:hypothetical protein